MHGGPMILLAMMKTWWKFFEPVYPVPKEPLE